MKYRIGISAALTGLLALHHTAATAADNLASAFDEGSSSGGLRTYYNHRDFDTKSDTSAFAAGGFLSATTAPVHNLSAAATFYSSHDLGTRDDDPAKNNTNLPENIDILAEAYLQYKTSADLLRIGRQIVNTPFANASDAFMIPVAYEAVSYTRTTGFGLNLQGLYLDRIKGRPDDDFSDVSDFSAARYGVSGAPNQGTLVAGATYQAGTTALQGWAYQLPDQFQLFYLQADLDSGSIASAKLRLSGQALYQQDDGAAVLGEVDTRAIGVKFGGTLGTTGLSAAWNQVEENRDAFNAGGILAPFNFSTSPVFTNSMLQTLENSTPGSAWKVLLESRFGSQFSASLSYADYARIDAVDASETDLDLTWRFVGNLDGLSFRLRVAWVEADTDAGNVTEVRPQLQYLF